MPARRRTLPRALAASLLLHAALLVVLWGQPRQAPAPPPPEPEPLQVPVEVEVLAEASPPPAPSRPRTREEPPPAAPPPAPPPPAPPPESRPVTQPPAPGTPVAEAPAPPTPSATPTAPPPTGPLAAAPAAPPPPGAPGGGSAGAPGGPGSGGPRKEPGLAQGLPGAAANESTWALPGETLRPGEGGEDPEAVAAAERARVKGRVDGALADSRADYRVRTGLVDAYFSELRKALSRGVADPPRLAPGKTFVEALIAAWAPGASQYGKTGNPYAEGAQPETPRELDEGSLLGRQIQDMPNHPLRDTYLKQQTGARLREFADGRFGEGLVAHVEVRQSRDGKLLEAALVRRSGNAVFDKFILEAVPVQVRSMPPPPKEGLGLNADGLRSVWAFEGRIVYKRKLKKGESIGVGDVAGVAAQQALSALTQGWIPGTTGTFDAATGEMSTVDLTHPGFEVRTRLLRVY